MVLKRPTHVTLNITDSVDQRIIIMLKDVNDETSYSFFDKSQSVQTDLPVVSNTDMFTLQARDPDTYHNIHYFDMRDRST